MRDGDLVARLGWLAEHDRCALVEVLRTVDPRALELALRLADPGLAAPTGTGSACSSAGMRDLPAAG